jgi:YVTN family beta-propeller protein
MRLIAVDKTGASLCLIDGETLSVLKRLPMPVSSHDFAFDPRGQRLFVSIYGSGVYGDNPRPGREIVVVDSLRFETTGSIDTSPYTSPHGLTFDRNGMLWATCDAHSCLVGFDTETGLIRSVVETQSSGSHWVLASAFTGCLYTSNKQDAFLTVVDPGQARLKAVILIPNGSEGMCFSPDGKLLYVADHKRPSVLVIDVSTLAIQEQIELDDVARRMEQGDARANHHMRVCVSPDGITLAVAAYHFDRLILVHLPDPRRQIALQTGRGPVALAFHPENPEALYFSNHDEGTLAVADTRLKKVVRTVDCDAGIEAMQFV